MEQSSTSYDVALKGEDSYDCSSVMHDGHTNRTATVSPGLSGHFFSKKRVEQQAQQAQRYVWFPSVGFDSSAVVRASRPRS